MTDPNNPSDNNDTTDSDCENDGQGVRDMPVIPLTPTPGSINPTVDCGYVCEGEIGDFVWLDFNGTPGCQDSDEPGINGRHREPL